MRQITEYLQEKKLLTDGAFGTYYARKYETEELPELANLTAPDRVQEIHREYIRAGARMIRTNTFACEPRVFNSDMELMLDNVCAACEIALQTAHEESRRLREEVYVFGSIGKIHAKIPDILDAMLQEGVRNFVFESFPDIDEFESALDHLDAFRKDHPEETLFILAQFCVNQHGYSNRGISARRLISEASADRRIDACGLNCGIGSGSMVKVVKGIDLNIDKYVSILPNASYPRVMSDRIVFSSSEEYFVQRMRELAEQGTDIIGGCCGTTPYYTKRMAKEIDLTQRGHHFPVRVDRILLNRVEKKDNSFFAGRPAEKKLLAVELSPPFEANDERMMDAVNELRRFSPDAVTVPDSPSGRTRADSVLMGLKMQSETGMTVIPHICCRDKNLIAMRSSLLGAYLNGMRNFLIVTGDPVPTMMRQDGVKGVFNFNSVSLMKMVREMNEDQFAADPIVFGGAINQNRKNLNAELDRIRKKIEVGARFFLTQPVFTSEDVDRMGQIHDVIRKENPQAKLLSGLMPLVSRRNALFIKNEMTGIHVTDEIVEKYGEDMSKEEGQRVGQELVRGVIGQLGDTVEGYYFTIPFNRVSLLGGIL